MDELRKGAELYRRSMLYGLRLIRKDIDGPTLVGLDAAIEYVERLTADIVIDSGFSQETAVNNPAPESSITIS